MTSDYISDAQKFSISAVGLKPNTYHKFMFDGSDNTSKCVQNRSSTINTSGLLSDANGTLNFDFYYDAGLDEAALTDLEQQNKLISSIVGTKTFYIESNDGNSTASGSIGLKYYTNIPSSYWNKTGLNISPTGTMTSVGDTVPNNPNSGYDSNQTLSDAIDSNSTKRAYKGESFNYNIRLR